MSDAPRAGKSPGKHQHAPRKAGKGLEVPPKKAKNKLRYSKQGREDMKEAALKGESWKGKMAIKRLQQQQEGSGSNPQAPGQKPRTGFNVGPRLAKGSYTGKFERIKAGLIHNAKIKQQYAKMLKREGLNAGDAKMDVEDSEVDGTDPGMEAEDIPTITSRRKGKGRARHEDDMQQDGPSPTKPVLRKRKSSELDRDAVERNPDDMESDNDEDGPAPGPSVSTPSHIHPSRREADSEPKHKRQKLSEEELEQKREKRRKDRQAWDKKTRKGQPNLGSRMGVLLGKIERTVSR